MQVTVHIGAFKTATSAIQFALARSDRVLSRVGAKYAETGLNVPFSKHLHLFDRIVDGGYNRQRHLTHKGEDYIGQLIVEAQEPGLEHLLLSEEELSYPSPAVAQYLAPLQDVADVEIVLVVRRQPEFLESLYLQYLKEPLRQVTDTFEEFLDSDYGKYGDFSSLLEMWEEVFGRESITVMDFDDLRNGDVVVNFANQVGLPKNLRSPDHNINPSITPASGELLRLIAVSTPQFPRMALASLLRQLAPGKGTTLLTPEITENILDRFRDSNARLADSYGIKLDREAELSKRPVTQAELDHQALEAAAQVIGAMWRRSRKAANAVQQISKEQEAALDSIRGLLKAGDDL